MKYISKKFIRVLGIPFVLVMTFYLGWVYYTDPSWVAIVRNRFNGELTLDTVPGWNITAPWVTAARIDTRPQRVCVLSAGQSFSCKLVQFNTVGWRDFVEIEGYHYYWWSNRISFNGGYNDEYRGMKDLLRGYAFTGKKYSFITILRDYVDQQ